MIALFGEIGEVAELVQWVPDDEFSNWLANAENKNALSYELADVLSYLLLLSDKCNIDVAAALSEKIALNEIRYPVSLSKGNSDKYTELAKVTERTRSKEA